MAAQLWFVGYGVETVTVLVDCGLGFACAMKIRIPYSHVTCITKENTALVIPNAIAVITHKKEYIFRSFWDR